MELKYTGPANTFDASQLKGAKKDLVFTRDGTPQSVSKHLGDELLTYPGHTFIDVTPHTAKGDTDAANPE